MVLTYGNAFDQTMVATMAKQVTECPDLTFTQISIGNLELRFAYLFMEHVKDFSTQ